MLGPSRLAPAALAMASLAALACGTLKPVMAYRSDVASPRLPLRVAVDVEVAPLGRPNYDESDAHRKEILNTELKAGDEVLIAESFKASVKEDIKANGPFILDEANPEATLKVAITEGRVNTDDLCIFCLIPPYFIWPLLALPTNGRSFNLTATAELRDTHGEVLASATTSSDCSSTTGLYYNQTVTFECAAVQIMEDLRGKLAAQKDTIAVKLKQSAANAAYRAAHPPEPSVPPPVSVPPPLPVAKPRVGSVLAVFDVEDTAHRFDDATTSQITEYLAARMAEVGHYRIVPRDQLRSRLSEEKQGSLRACYDEACQIELGKAMAAHKSLATKLLRIGNTCAMTSTLYDLKTETTERAASARTNCDADALLGGIDAIVVQLKPD